MIEPTLCIYHGNCADGFGAAWAVWKRFPDCKFHAGIYGQEPPDCTGEHVVLVDFSYKKPVLDEMCKKAYSMIVLDHHKSAADDLKDAKKYSATWEQHHAQVYQDRCENADINGAVLYALFDMNRSGAMIAWEFFHHGKKPPQLILHIQDRDLWKFEIGRTREVQANLFSYPYEFKIWDDLMFRMDDPDEHRRFVAGGEAIERKHHKDIAEILKVTKRQMVIGGYQVWIANLPYTMASDAGHAMCGMFLNDGTDEEPGTPTAFAASYYDKPEGRVFSLRSIGNFDVSDIAKKYGGGGHKNAAGFIMPIGWEGEK